MTVLDCEVFRGNTAASLKPSGVGSVAGVTAVFRGEYPRPH